MKVVLLNGASGSGKDTLAAILRSSYGFTHMELKKRAVELVRAIYGISEVDWNLIYTREYKDTPYWKLKNHSGAPWMSPRQALIYVAEEVIKPNMCRTYFTECLIGEIPWNTNKIVVSDLGFPEEAKTFLKYYKKEDIHVVKMYRDGHTFQGDSREMVDSGLFLEGNVYSFINKEGDMDSMKAFAEMLADKTQ